MRKNSALLLACLMLAWSSYGQASAHGTEKHGKPKAAAAQMKKLHDMMPMFSVATAKLESALDKGDAATVETEAGRILDALRDSDEPSTVVVIAYRQATISLADEVVWLEQGRVLARGTHEQLLETVPGYAALVRAYSQAEVPA